MIHNESINQNNIIFHKPLYYSKEYTFINIKYNHKDILIQTPNLYSQYGINTKHNNIDILFQNINNDKNVKLLKDNLELIYNKIIKKYSKYNVIPIFKNNLELRLKIKNDILIFNQNKKIVKTNLSNTYSKYIINLKGLWLINNTNIYIQFYLLQAKIDKIIILDEYAFIEKKKNIPPPPPLPVFKKSNPLIIIKNKKMKISKKEKSIEPPSLNDIKNALFNLKKIK